jgi:hypothetical protein
VTGPENGPDRKKHRQASPRIEIESSDRRRHRHADTAREKSPHLAGKSHRANYISNINTDDPADR